ncbi:MAG: RNA-binding protein Jag [Candidatus Ozemobacter sibiricus]|uniref:RNA-binding protein KhpB n=1 Tax=Candidatus Ozemobacter sibiricus TaxID=2268124 RepID=A0A367ZRE6_9BACT|nr:MAG: RNA-binding protein Jag [Candidatus Ozemobacter sibiricus]
MTTRRFIEITAKSPEEARQLAERELKEGERITASEVLQAPARGIFGVVGNPETRLRFTCEMAPPVVEESRPAPRVETSRARAVPAAIEAEGEPDEDHDDHEALDAYDDEVESEDADEGDAEAEDAAGPASAPGVDDGFDVTQDPMWGTIQALLQKVATTLGVKDPVFRTYRRDGTSIVEAAGENVSQLIGKHGRTLDSLQYLLNIVLNKGRDDRTKLVLDVQGYREKRHKNLIMLANRMYRKVIDTGRQVELEPMSTLDRRTVHLALKDRSGVETYSRGVEPMRRVVIAPTRPGTAANGPGRGRGDRGGRRHERGEARDRRPASTRDEAPTRPSSVPMFFEGDGSDEG